MFLDCECCKPSPLNVLQLSILHSIRREGGIPPFLENGMKKNQCLLHFQGFLNIPLPSGKVYCDVIKENDTQWEIPVLGTS